MVRALFSNPLIVVGLMYIFFFLPFWYVFPIAGLNAGWAILPPCIPCGAYLTGIASVAWLESRERAQ